MNIKDYLHLYLGCEVLFKDEVCILHQYNFFDNIVLLDPPDGSTISIIASEVKPILRPLSDMTEEEAKEGRKIYDDMVEASGLNGEIEAARTVYLLSKGFDLFRLIDNGLAISKTVCDVPNKE